MENLAYSASLYSVVRSAPSKPGINILARPFEVPALIWVSVVGVLMSVPLSPLAAIVNPAVAMIGILPLATPVLAYAGLSLAKDMPILKALGWRIVVVSLIAKAGAFLAGALIGQSFG